MDGHIYNMNNNLELLVDAKLNFLCSNFMLPSWI